MQIARHTLSALALALTLGATPVMAADAEPLTVAATLRVVGATIDGERIAELSGLAWDADEQRLYAISDRGVLFRFSLMLGANGQLEVEPIAASRLAPPAGSNAVDAEGLAVTGADEQPCAVRELAVLDRPDETDNFEGLTYLGGGRVMIVSDDRGKSGRGTTFTVLQRRATAD